MKNRISVVAVVLALLVILCSCIIVLDPDRDDSDKISVSSVFKGPVKDSSGKVKSYQYMAYVKNNTSQPMENLKVCVIWEDSLGDEIMRSNTITIPRLESGMMWPISDYRTSASDINRLNSLYSTATVKYLSSGSASSSKYVTGIEVVNPYIYHTEGSQTVVTGKLRNPYYSDVKYPTIYVVSESSSGKIVEYGYKKLNGTIVHGFDVSFEMTLNPPAGTPKAGKTYFFVVGTKDE